MFEKPSNTFKQQPKTVHKPSNTFTTFKQPIEDRSNNFNTIQKPSKPFAPVCMHLWGALII
eukprot:1488193-Heterocapsa_arctica.AAC.1